MSACECTEDIISLNSLSSLTKNEAVRTETPNKQLLDFGSVEIGKEKWITINVKNQSNRENLYIVTRDPDTNPLYQTFGFKSYKVRANAHETVRFCIFYRPKFAGIRNFDTFQITDAYNTTELYAVYGSGLGPNVQVSCSWLRFASWNERPICKQTIELLNKSSVDAYYCIDCDEQQTGIFQIDKRYGVIARKSYVYVNVTFAPERYGTFAHDLEIILLHHDPLFVRLYGSYAREFSELHKNDFLDSGYNCAEKISYLRYMKDVQSICAIKDNLFFTLTETCMNFGSYSKELANCKKTFITSLTNHTQGTVHVEWHKDKNFPIIPQSVDIESGHNALFECTFEPHECDSLYGRVIDGNVFWKSTILHFDEKPRELAFLPDTLNLRMIGHSFSENSLWIPLIDIIPDVVILPPTIPSQPSFTTFELKSKGYLPVTFHFQPPTDTKFILKPMLGLFRTSQFIVAQLQPDESVDENGKIYVEQWTMIMNNEAKHKIVFYLKGYAEGPRIIVGTDNTIKFLGVQRGCTNNKAVLLRNISQHYIQFKFITKGGCLSEESVRSLIITPMEGRLCPNEAKEVVWSLTSSANATIRCHIDCSVHVLVSGDTVIGKSIEIPIALIIESSFSEITCIPKMCDLGCLLLYTKQHVTIELYNFGRTFIYFELFARDRRTGKNDTTLTCSINAGTLEPHASIHIIIQFNANVRGQHDVDLYYHLRTAADELDIVPNYEKQIFTLTCLVVMPYVQVIDVLEHNYGPLFSKTLLWNLIGLDGLNDHLRNIDSKNNSKLSLNLPDYPFGHDMYHIRLLLKNCTEFPLNMALKRHQLCDCRLQEAPSTSPSIRKLEYVCPHRNTFNMNIEHDIIEADSYQVLTLNVCYSLMGTTIMSYYLQCSFNHSLLLDFHIRCLNDIGPFLSNYKPTFSLHMNATCLSELNPSIYCFWLYNNTGHNANYVLDVNKLNELNAQNNFVVYQCLNPSGTINIYSKKAILFKYTPIQRHTFNIKLPLRLATNDNECCDDDDDCNELEICGSSTKHFTCISRSKESMNNSHTTSLRVATRDSSCELIASETFITIDSFPVWSRTVRLIFIRNLSKDQVYGYSWQKCDVDDLITVEIKQRKGVLRPKEAQAILIEFKSYDKPCQVQVPIICKVLNHTAYHAHKKSLSDYKRRQRELEGQFTITEKGTSYPENDVKILSYPQLNYIDVTCDLHVTSLEDRDLHYTPKEQMQHTAYENDNLTALLSDYDNDNNNNEDDGVEDDEKEFLLNVLQCILSDTIFSNLYREYLFMNQEQSGLYYYTQLTNNATDDNVLLQQPQQQQQQDEKQPSRMMSCAILNDLVVNCVHQMFQLGASPKSVVSATDLSELSL